MLSAALNREPGNSKKQPGALTISATFVVLCFLLSAPFWYLEARLPRSGPTLYSTANMFCPALAAVIARLLFRRNLRGFGFIIGKPRWLVLAVLLPALAGLVIYGAAWLFHIAPLNETNLFRFFTPSFIPLFFGVLTFCCVGALGEELGWRGLLVPELSRCMGYTKLSFVSGIIWTLWHLPLILYGSYHGTGPLWLSLLSFTLLILSSSFVHAWMRLVSGSVWVSMLLHGSSNYFIQVFYPTLTIQTTAGDAMLGEFGWFAPIISVVVAVIFWSLRSRVPSIVECRDAL